MKYIKKATIFIDNNETWGTKRKVEYHIDNVIHSIMQSKFSCYTVDNIKIESIHINHPVEYHDNFIGTIYYVLIYIDYDKRSVYKEKLLNGHSVLHDTLNFNGQLYNKDGTIVFGKIIWIN